MAGGLPYGRGSRTGPTAAIEQGESDAIRRQLLPDRNGWVVSPLGDLLQAEMQVTATELVASRLYLFWIPTPLRMTGVKQARLRVAYAGAASSTVKTALYRYSANTFIKMAGTDATFDGSSLGLKTVTLKDQVLVGNEGNIFLGVNVSDAAIAIEGMSSGAVGRLFNNYYAVVSGLESNLPKSTLTAETTVDTPFVLYLSTDAAQVL